MFLNEYEDDLLLDDYSCELLSDDECSDEDDLLSEGFLRMAGGDIKDFLTLKRLRDWITGSNPAEAKEFFKGLREFVKEEWEEDNNDNWLSAFDRNQRAQQAMWVWYPRNVNIFLEKIADNSKYLFDSKITKNVAGAAALGEQLMTKNGTLKAIDQVEANYEKFVAAWKKHNNTANSVIIGSCLAAFAQAVRTAVRSST